MINRTEENLLSDLQSLIQTIVKAQTDNLAEIVKIAGLDTTADFAEADLSSTRLRGIN
ncbi:MAG TPA: low-complexity protein, partial [Cyanobacteria bacterium UBA11162]|nr:low-complexity protein [Cyanobacteria bacterium UBA11162]